MKIKLLLYFIFFTFIFSVSNSVFANNKNQEINQIFHQMFNEAITEFMPKNVEEKNWIKGLSDEIKANKFDGYSLVKGDLNNDGEEDVVAMSSGNPYIIVVLQGQKEGNLIFWTRSKLLCRSTWNNNIEIKKQSIFITESYDNTTMWTNNSFQFKYKNGKLVLIGADFFTGEKGENYTEEGTPSKAYKSSYNYLTNQSIETIIKKWISSEKKIKLESKPLQKLNQFSGSVDCHEGF
jgi:hypothetical protein